MHHMQSVPSTGSNQGRYQGAQGSKGPIKCELSLYIYISLYICSEPKLNLELAKNKSTLINNGYPEDLISACFCNKIAGFSDDKKIGPQKCPVYLKLPYIGNVSMRFERQIKKAITKCYATVSPRLVFSSRKIIPSIRKDSVPTTQNGLKVYEYWCWCDARCAGRTSQWLCDGIITRSIVQHMPKNCATTRKTILRLINQKISQT